MKHDQLLLEVTPFSTDIEAAGDEGEFIPEKPAEPVKKPVIHKVMCHLLNPRSIIPQNHGKVQCIQGLCPLIRDNIIFGITTIEQTR